MPKLSVEELIFLDNPYIFLFKSHSNELFENIKTLELLMEDEKIALVTTIILECPSSELDEIFKLVSTLALDINGSDRSLLSLLAVAVIIRQQVEKIAVINSSDAHQFLLYPEFKIEHYHLFTELCTSLANQHGNRMACNLVLHSTTDKLNELVCNVKSVFSRTFFETELSGAIRLNSLLINLIEHNPLDVFTSRKFDPKLFHLFPSLVIARLSGFERQIAMNLSSNTTLEVDVTRILEKLIPEEPHAESPFKLILIVYEQLLGLTILDFDKVQTVTCIEDISLSSVESLENTEESSQQETLFNSDSSLETSLKGVSMLDAPVNDPMVNAPEPDSSAPPSAEVDWLRFHKKPQPKSICESREGNRDQRGCCILL